jgi:hypothetical protein
MIPDMTLLDYFAGQALVGLLMQPDSTDSGLPCPMWYGAEDRTNLCQRAYRIAEEMLVQRKIIAADKKETP